MTDDLKLLLALALVFGVVTCTLVVAAKDVGEVFHAHLAQIANG